jgi:hypothetical protein
MEFELKENQGIFYRNSYKKEGDNKPEYIGTVKIAGIEYKLKIWKTKSGKAYNIKVSKKYPEQRKHFHRHYETGEDVIMQIAETKESNLPF